MGKFEDYIRSLNPDIVLPEGFLGELQTAHTEDIDLSTAKVSSLESEIAKKDQSISALTTDLTTAKSHNYDLLLQVPKKIDEPIPPAGDPNESLGIDDLFGDSNGT